MELSGVKKTVIIAVGFEKRDPLETGLFSRISSTFARAILCIASFFSKDAATLLNAVKADEALRSNEEEYPFPDHEKLLSFYRSLAPAVDSSHNADRTNLSLQAISWWGSLSLKTDVNRLDHQFQAHGVKDTFQCLQNAEAGRNKARKDFSGTLNLEQLQARIHEDLLMYRGALRERVSSIWNLVSPGQDYEKAKNCLALDFKALSNIFQPSVVK